jgi:hypothetical protein
MGLGGSFNVPLGRRSRFPEQLRFPALRVEPRLLVRDFCKGLSLCPRGHTCRRNDERINVWCFAEEADAQKFITRFGGEMIDPDKQTTVAGEREAKAVARSDTPTKSRSESTLPMPSTPSQMMGR